MQAPPNLWNSPTCEQWHASADSYPEVVTRQEVAGLEELDRWYRETLPDLLHARLPVYATRDELVSVTRWKMKRGVWRQRNLLLVEGNSEEAVEAASRAAFLALPDPRKPLALLTELSGVGPATASALLAAHSPAIYPFFDELVAAQIPGMGAVAFTMPYYTWYSSMLREKAAQLSSLCPHEGWTAQRVSQALWANSGGKADSRQG